MKLTNYPKNTDFYFSHRIKKHDKGEVTMVRHYHDLYEIYYLEKGRCHYFIDSKIYILDEGDIALIPAGVIHNTLYKNSQYSRMLINCSEKFIPQDTLSLIGNIHYVYRNEESTPQIYRLMKEIEKEYKKKAEFSDKIIACDMQRLFYFLVTNKNEYADKGITKDYIEKALFYIRENYTSEITLMQIAEMFSISPGHFSREIKRETGLGFCEYVNLLRLKKAEELLRQNPKIKITEVSDACGFNDSNYFSLKFKSFYGISPKQMQKNSQKI